MLLIPLLEIKKYVGPQKMFIINIIKSIWSDATKKTNLMNEK